MNFDKLTNRFNTNSYKWDCKETELPMSIADMDFEVANEIYEAILDRAKAKTFGYSYAPDAYFEAYVSWFKNRYNLSISSDDLIYSLGVVPSISSIVRKITSVGENVLIQSPVYNIFYNSIVNNGRNIVSNDLVYSGGKYSIDFDDLELKLQNKQTSLMILCNPHNPVGRVWTKEELEKIGELCHKYNVVVLSDEIHCDITRPGVKYTPFASVNEVNKSISITCLAPTKTFNLAGLQSSVVYIPNKYLYHKVWRGLNTDEVAEGNAFSYDPVIAAYTKCGYWVDAMREYVWENKRVLKEFIENEIPQIKYVDSDATYLAWIDLGCITNDSSEFCKFLQEKTGLILNSGSSYGPNGKTFVRMNLATSRIRVLDGLNRLKEAVNSYGE